MPKQYSRKSSRGDYGQQNLDAAVQAMNTDGLSIRHAATMFHVPKSTLERHVNKKIIGGLHFGRAPCLSRVPENELANHIKLLASRGYGVTPLEVRKLAFDYAEANKIPNNFNKTEGVAGYDWLLGFYKRHRDISVRKPEGLSAARAMGMNRVKVGAHFDLLQETRRIFIH